LKTTIASWFESETERRTGWWTDRWGTAGRDDRPADALGALGYLGAVRAAGSADWVTVHDPERAYPGLNVFTSGHRPEAFLVSMDGTILHKWWCDFFAVWPDADVSHSTSHEYFRRGHLFENGDFLGLIADFGLVKVDKDSRVLWARSLRTHHDLEVMPDGRIYVLTREMVSRPDVLDGAEVFDDRIAVLDPEGRETLSVSMLDALLDSPYAPVLDHAQAYDPLHTNSVEVLDGRLADRIPAFAKGNVLTSFRHLNMIAVVDMNRKQVAWAMTGMWDSQHDPTVVDSGRLMVFDNRGLGELSRVIEFLPDTQEVTWRFEGNEENRFYSISCGANRLLPNGDVLITETDGGRAIEVTRGGEIVWEFLNPHRGGENDELVAVIFDMVRLPEDFPTDWIE
jgi:hypothetical protein